MGSFAAAVYPAGVKNFIVAMIIQTSSVEQRGAGKLYQNKLNTALVEVSRPA